MKNICELLLLKGRHWYSTDENFKFYYVLRYNGNLLLVFFWYIILLRNAYIYAIKIINKLVNKFLNIVKVLLVYNPTLLVSLLIGTRTFFCLIWYLNKTWKPTDWAHNKVTRKLSRDLLTTRRNNVTRSDVIECFV